MKLLPPRTHHLITGTTNNVLPPWTNHLITGTTNKVLPLWKHHLITGTTNNVLPLWTHHLTTGTTNKVFRPFCRPTKALRVSRCIALLFLGPRHQMTGGGRPHAPSTSTPGKDPVPILLEAGWSPGPVWTGVKSRPHRDSIPDRPARSQSLHRLSYRAHTTNTCMQYNHAREIVVSSCTMPLCLL